MLSIVVIFSVMVVIILAMAPMASEQKNESTSADKQLVAEHQIHEKKDDDIKRAIKLADNASVVKPDPIKEIAPQVNNYNFDSIGNGLMSLVAMIASLFGVNYLIKLFAYIQIIRKFGKNERKTNQLIKSLNPSLDNQKDFLILSDSIEHQLKVNNLLLQRTDWERYGLDLEVADERLYKEYSFFNEKIMKTLK